MDKLLEAMRDWLLHSHQFARWKWNHREEGQQPGTEAATNEEMVKLAANEGASFGLSRSRLEDFFAAQFAASRLMQEADFKHWQAENRGPFQDLPDLTNVMRPRLGQFTHATTTALFEMRESLGTPETKAKLRERAPTVLTGDGITAEIRKMALEPLLRW